MDEKSKPRKHYASPLVRRRQTEREDRRAREAKRDMYPHSDTTFRTRRGRERKH